MQNQCQERCLLPVLPIRRMLFGIIHVFYFLQTHSSHCNISTRPLYLQSIVSLLTRRLSLSNFRCWIPWCPTVNIWFAVDFTKVYVKIKKGSVGIFLRPREPRPASPAPSSSEHLEEHNVRPHALLPWKKSEHRSCDHSVLRVRSSWAKMPL